jgi:HK97 family phage major capsid protein
MSKKLNQLKQERTEQIELMNNLRSLCDKEKRSKSEEETANWNKYDSRINELDAEISQEERIEKLNKTIVSNKPATDTPEDKAARKYDLSKAIRESRSGNLTGLELEMHDEGCQEYNRAGVSPEGLIIPEMIYKRADEQTKATGVTGGHIPTNILGLDVTVPNPIYRQIGCTVYEGLKGKFEIPFSDGHDAAFVAEEGDAAQSTPANTKGALSAERVQGWQLYSREYLAESVVMPDLLGDMIASIDRAVDARILLAAAAGNVMTGFATIDTGAALDWNGALEMIAELTADNFKKEAFVMSRALFYNLAGIERASGTAQFIVREEKGKAQQGSIFGVPAYGTSNALPVHDTNKYDIVYLDAAKTYVGFWGGVEVLVDPYTSSDKGRVKITFSRLADTVVNPAGVASKRNVILA